jgi:hypothetical protein
MALASSGAATLVGLMISDSWVQVKDGIARMLARGKAVEQVEQELDVSHAELLAASRANDERLAVVIEGAWRARLHSLLQGDPALAEDLRHLMEALSVPKARPSRSVHNVISGGVQHGPVIQAGRISGLAFGGPSTSGGDED